MIINTVDHKECPMCGEPLSLMFKMNGDIPICYYYQCWCGFKSSENPITGSLWDLKIKWYDNVNSYSTMVAS